MAVVMALQSRRLGAELAERIVRESFAAQRAVAERVLAGQRRTAVLCPRRAGKSYAIATILVAICLRRPGARCLWLALTQKHIKRIAWDILATLSARYSLGAVGNKSTLVWLFPNGSTIELDGADNVKEESEKYTGAKLSAAAIDEAGSFGPELLEYLWDSVVRPALIDMRGAAILGGTPRHILKGLFYDATRGVLSDWAAEGWSTLDNPHVADQMRDEIAEMKAANPDVESTTAYRREILGEWCPDATDFVYGSAGPRHYVHDVWSPGDGRWLYVTGADVGYDDDFALVQLALDMRDRKRLHVVEAWKSPGLHTAQMAEACKRFSESYPGTVFVFDPAWKTTVQDLRVMHQIPITIAKKQRKQDAIRTFNGELDGMSWSGGAREIKIHMPACKSLVDEISVLPWHTTGRGERVESPGFPNHCADAMLYGWRHVVGWGIAAEDDEKESYNERTLRVLKERAGRSSMGGVL